MSENWASFSAPEIPGNDGAGVPNETASLLENYDKLRRNRTALVNRSGLVGVRSGNETLDDLLGGHHGVTIIGGISGVGKTSFALQSCIAGALADPSVGIALFNYECTSPDEILDQLHCMLAGVGFRTYASDKSSQEEQARLDAARALLRDHLLPRMQIKTLKDHMIDDHGWFTWMYAWRRAVNHLLRQTGVRRVITVIDRLQLMPHPKMHPQTYDENREMVRLIEAAPDAYRMEQIREASRESANADAGGLSWPFFVVCETRKKNDPAKELETDDILGSVGTVYDVDRVLLLQPRKGKATDAFSPVELKVAKARRSQRCRLQLLFRHQQFRFDEIALPGAPVQALQSNVRVSTKPQSGHSSFEGR